jgi:hypothetical protein
MRTTFIVATAIGLFVTGAAARAAAETKVEMTVQLPPFIIEQPAGPRWRYLRTPRFEVLSRCDGLTTEQIATGLHRANQLLAEIVPERFHVTFDVPPAVILYEQRLWSAKEQEAMLAVLGRNPADASRPAGPRQAVEPVTGASVISGRETSSPARGFFFRNLMLADADTMTTFVMVSDAAIDPEASYLAPAYVRGLLRSRVPALPEWFITGFMQLYGGMEFSGPSVSVRVARWQHGGMGGGVADPRFLPWGDLLTDRQPDGDWARWLAQCELFVAWGLDPNGGRRDGFWQLLERAASEPVTESLVRECLGLAYAGLDASVAGHGATTRTLRWTLSNAAARLPGKLEDASSRQVARIKGEWERLEVRYVRQHRPELAGHYLELARGTLRRAYDRGDRDPQLLASLGLLELEAGDKAAAIGYLEQAAEGGVVRPRAYFELARLRYDQLVGRSTREDGKYTAGQVESVVRPLLAGTRQSPALAASYQLMAHVAAQGVEPPSREVTEALREGARLFPAKRQELVDHAFRPAGEE